MSTDHEHEGLSLATLAVGEAGKKGTIRIAAKSSIAPFIGTSSTVYMGLRDGEPIALIDDPQQLQFDLDDETPPAPRALPKTGTDGK